MKNSLFKTEICYVNYSKDYRLRKETWRKIEPKKDEEHLYPLTECYCMLFSIFSNLPPKLSFPQLVFNINYSSQTPSINHSTFLPNSTWQLSPIPSSPLPIIIQHSPFDHPLVFQPCQSHLISSQIPPEIISQLLIHLVNSLDRYICLIEVTEFPLN